MNLDVVNMFITYCNCINFYVLYNLFQAHALQINYDAAMETALIRHMPVTTMVMTVIATQMKLVAHVSNDIVSF